MKNFILVLIASLSLGGCGTHPSKKSESLDAVSSDKIFPNIQAIIKNKSLSPEIRFRESKFTFDWRDTLMSTEFGRVPVKMIPINLTNVINSSKPKITDRFKHFEVKVGRYLTLCSEFSPADRNAASAIVPEVHWLSSKGQTQRIPAVQFNRNLTTGMNGCLASTFILPESFPTNSLLIVHPKRFDSFVKPIASFQTETMVMAGPVFVPIKGVVQVLPSVVGDIRFEISDEKKYSEGANKIEDLY